MEKVYVPKQAVFKNTFLGLEIPTPLLQRNSRCSIHVLANLRDLTVLLTFIGPGKLHFYKTHPNVLEHRPVL